MWYQVETLERQAVGRCLYEKSLWFKLKGLLGRSSLEAGEGILLKGCKQIHMFGMRFAIDAVFLDKKNRIIHIENSIQPWAVSKMIWNSNAVLEFPAGTMDEQGIAVGDELSLQAES